MIIMANGYVAGAAPGGRRYANDHVLLESDCVIGQELRNIGGSLYGIRNLAHPWTERNGNLFSNFNCVDSVRHR